ncbi:hypothetical protein CesoFtcFv8_009719 [Champsocephalus esox]|uniref:Uncharacterized protein n=1 Tax=Champsocephalus esox TaxID=159716 RepID=A0AAN8C3E2_9TELE|nr:hypothetical protein CesoFtcFv8_009719 [Champsocephalus esox]
MGGGESSRSTLTFESKVARNLPGSSCALHPEEPHTVQPSFCSASFLSNHITEATGHREKHSSTEQLLSSSSEAPSAQSHGTRFGSGWICRDRLHPGNSARGLMASHSSASWCEEVRCG